MTTAHRKLETQAKAWLAATKNKPVGPDRTPYVSVDYCAKGAYECVTRQGGREYVDAKTLRGWTEGKAAV